MTKASFFIRLADLDRGVRDFDWELPVEWLAHAFVDTDATPNGPGRVTMTANKSGSQVILHGRAKAKVTMPCARTLEPVPLSLDADIVLLLRPAPIGATGKKSAPVKSSKNPVPPSQEPHRGPKVAPSRRREAANGPDTELSWEDASEDFYQGEQIELDAFIREFLVLELPMMPLRSDLRFEGRPAISATPDSTSGNVAGFVDPRLQPLAEIASRLKKTTKE